MNTVTYDQAKKLKELGYSEEVLRSYHNKIGWGERPFLDSRIGLNNYNKEKYNKDGWYNTCSAPSVSEALQWIREKYSKIIVFEIKVFPRSNGDIIYPYTIYDYNSRIGKYERFMVSTVCKSYPEAESALLNELLTYLEQKK
ncbi:hypothetical protein JGH11_17010 [Dysgonomonas sp. Marseille-P4677]|uniref:hypothetical protein n=1 Tax=Dysgonomonas sp. Marseille-P4677 TaxID=2364790 RepID=UPI0019137967|nr:hypothetical protein [Dysgonomonas sp. Marseille-P4677]MBK5722576.1 hypothetical protein [Dysgonomonas sp. Marseille-P4677]